MFGKFAHQEEDVDDFMMELHDKEKYPAMSIDTAVVANGSTSNISTPEQPRNAPSRGNLFELTADENVSPSFLRLSSDATPDEVDAQDERIKALAQKRRIEFVAHRRKKRRQQVLSTAAKTIVYLAGMTTFFCLREHWSVTKALYFTMATMSTVGYGDVSPGHNVWNRAFCVFGIFTGIIFVFSQVATLFSTISDPIFQKGRDLLEYIWPQTAIDIDGDGDADYKVPRHFVIFYLKNLMPSNLSFVLLQAGSALIFQHLEGWDFGSAMYHCLVTASTVGYGDVPITTDGGMQWATCHIFISVCMLGALISDVDTLRQQRHLSLRQAEELRRTLDHELIDNLLVRAKELRPHTKRDGKGLTELEFSICMMLELEICTWSQVRPFILQFRRLDFNKSGRLGYKDLEHFQSAKRQSVLTAHRKAGFVGALGGIESAVEEKLGAGAHAINDAAVAVKRSLVGRVAAGKAKTVSRAAPEEASSTEVRV